MSLSNERIVELCVISQTAPQGTRTHRTVLGSLPYDVEYNFSFVPLYVPVSSFSSSERASMFRACPEGAARVKSTR